MTPPETARDWVVGHPADLRNTLECGFDNGWTEGQAEFAPFCWLVPEGLVVMLHDGFMTVGYDGDSDTFELSGDHEQDAARAVQSLESFFRG